MRYLGGKARIAKHIAPIILESKPKTISEPFCGALNVTAKLLELDPELIVYASDSDKDLINMWIAVQQGWLPPDSISREEYYELKIAESSPLRTFAGYGCAFMGSWFQGYAPHSKGHRSDCLEAKNSLIKKAKNIDRIVFSHCDYTENTQGDVIYCDPPYVGTYRPSIRDSFDTALFWKWAEDQTKPIYVSEKQAPNTFIPTWIKDITTASRGSTKVWNDVLFKKGD